MRTPILRLRGALAGALLLVAAAGGCKSTTASEDLPATITVCETNTATLCAPWTRQSNGTYVADWAQGSHAVIQVTHFSSTNVVFVRDDPSGTSAGMHAVYTGTPVSRTVTDGLVTWSRNGEVIQGHWTGSW